MPTIKKRFYRRKTSASELTEEAIVELLHGLCFSGRSNFQSEADKRRAYKDHREYLLSLQVDNSVDSQFTHYRYGERPVCWWQFEDLPEKRRVKEYFTSPVSVNKEPMPVYEPQQEYLTRNGLLNDTEKIIFQGPHA